MGIIRERDIVWESNDVKLLGITLNNKLKFDKHVFNISSEGNRKLSALTRVAKFFKKGLIAFKALTEAQFKYCLLVWMFHGRQIKDKINKLHKRALRIVHNDSITSLDEFLER